MKPIRRLLMYATGLVSLAVPPPAGAQTVATLESSRAVTLAQALRYAVDHYPSVRAAVEQLNASAAGVQVARAAYLPRLDAVYQLNRGTANNVFGQVLPQGVLPSLSGPVLPATTWSSVWGSAAGALLSWDAFDFGLRRATVRSAEAATNRARAEEALTRLEVESAVAAAFFASVEADHAAAAARADLDRRDVLARAVHALVDSELRPGAEASRADAERAAAQTRAVLAQQAAIIARATLGRVLGLGGIVSAADLAPPTVPVAPPRAAPTVHPLALARKAAVTTAETQEDVLAHADRPRVTLQSSVFARGSGANPDGHFDAGTDGLGLERANWVAGIQFVVPNLFDGASLRARRAASAAETRAERARYDEALLGVQSDQLAAQAMIDAARTVAANVPAQLDAARSAETQARARYDAGLAGIVEIADAQNVLAQAEYAEAVANVGIWRALLADAAAHGDLAPFEALASGQGAR